MLQIRSYILHRYEGDRQRIIILRNCALFNFLQRYTTLHIIICSCNKKCALYMLLEAVEMGLTFLGIFCGTDPFRHGFSR
jgi:hypothetical protein